MRDLRPPSPDPVRGRRRSSLVVAVALFVGGPLTAGSSALAATAPAASPAPAPAPADGPVGGPRMASGGVVAELAPGVPRPPEVVSASYVVADAATGRILAAKAPHTRLPPASTLKTLTGLALIDRLDPSTPYVATADDANMEGSRVGVVPGGRYSVRNLFEGLFLASGNDAASALANVNGGLAVTVAQMNDTARDLQARDTLAVNTSGLDEPGQLTSAYDLALIGRAALGKPALMRYAGLVKSTFPGKIVPAGKHRPHFEIYTHQRFLRNYDGALGIKNGYTSTAKNTLVAASTRGGRTLVVTLLKAPGQAWREAAALSDWGYRYFDALGAAGELVPPLSTLAPTPAPEGDVPADQVDADAAAGTSGGGAEAAAPGTGEDGGVGLLTVVGVVTGSLAAAVVALRARVLVRRHRRMRRLRPAR